MAVNMNISRRYQTPDLYSAAVVNVTNYSTHSDAKDVSSSSYSLNTTTIIVISLYGLICLIGLLGNGLVIFVILRYKKLKTVTNVYIFNLSVADSLFLIVLPLLITTAIAKEWIFGTVMCKIYYMLTSINNFTSSFTLIVMAIDRYMAACHPITSRNYRTLRYANIGLLIIWIMSFIVMMPVIMYAEVDYKSSCVINWPNTSITGSKAFIIYSMIMAFGIPVILICTFYTLTMTNLRLRHTEARSRAVAQQRYLQFRKATKLVTLIIVVYILCWLPHWLLQIYLISRSAFTAPPKWIFHLYQIFAMLTYSNSMLNPLLYAFTNEYFRAAFLKTFTCLPGVIIPSQETNDTTMQIDLKKMSTRASVDCSRLL